MPSKEVLDFGKLLAPVSAEHPTGTDPRADISHSSPFQEIKGVRNTSSTVERKQATRVPTDEVADWKKVRELAEKVLIGQAKDLQIAAFLIEALLRLEGFAGLRDGFRLARELVERFGDAVFPLPDEDGPAGRITALVKLGETADGPLIAPITRVPLTANTSAGRFTLANFNEGTALKKISDAKLVQKKLDDGAVSLDVFHKAVAESSPAFYRNLVEDLTAATNELGKLDKSLVKLGPDLGLPTSNIRDILTRCFEVVKDVSGDKWKPAVDKPAAGPADAVGETVAHQTVNAAAQRTGGAPSPATLVEEISQNRQQVLANLERIADYFRRTESHSPVSYALDQAVRWARMPLPELWAELVPDEAPRKSLFRQVGIRPPEEAPKGAPKK